jgi:hypothetical protein
MPTRAELDSRGLARQIKPFELDGKGVTHSEGSLSRLMAVGWKKAGLGSGELALLWS